MSDCAAALNLKGQHYPCDWPSDDDGKHDGWAHANSAAGAVWCSPTDKLGRPQTSSVPSAAAQ
jgi:hypothetical protein